MATVKFLNAPEGDINQYAHCDTLLKGGYWIHNLNMPYQGTLTEHWSQETLDAKIASGKVQYIPTPLPAIATEQ